MPSYDYLCSSCKKTEEHTHGISESPEIKCSLCGSAMERQFSLNRTGFILKGGSEAIHYREKQNRLKKRDVLEKKQRERWGNLGPKIQPNVMGHPMETWTQAKEVAKDVSSKCGMNAESYTPFAEKEKKRIIV